jgi:polygalacturonase
MDFLVTDYGAAGDGETLDTGAIQSAIDSAHAERGGRVVLPAGKKFRSGSLVLRENIELHIESGATLQASSDYADYPATLISSLTGGQVDEYVLPQRALIAAFRADNIKITGAGEINGNADGFIEVRGEYIHQMRDPVDGKSQYLERPFTIFLIDCQQVELLDFTLRDPAFWAIRTTGCHDLLIDNIKILTDLMVPNADGIDIDRCQRVVIQNCELVTADDCISLKSCAGTSQYGDVSDVEIRNCDMISTSGAITLGTESVGDIRNVLVTDCRVTKSHRGFAVRAREGGEISNVLFRNSTVETRTFSPAWWGHGEALHVTAFAWNEPEHLSDGNPERLIKGRVKNIRFENLEIDTEAGILVWAQEDRLAQDISFENLRIIIGKKSKWPARIDLRPNDVTPVIERKANAFEIANCRELSILDCVVTWDQATRSEYVAPVWHQNVQNLRVSNLVEGLAE